MRLLCHVRYVRLTKPCGQAQIGFMPYAIDTAATIADLESAGVEPGQARAIVHAINGAVGDPVSKEDFRELRGEFKSLDGKFTKLRDEMDRRFAELRDEMDRRFAELHDEIDRKFAEQRDETNRKFAEQREEMDRKFATKADLALLRSQLTTRIILSQVATVALLFMLLKLFA